LSPDITVGIGVAARIRERNIAGLSNHGRANTNKMNVAIGDTR
jgi:hypothetical protein